MRLINVSTLQIHRFEHVEAGSYAVLSHRWGAVELTLQEYVALRRDTSLTEPSKVDFGDIDDYARPALEKIVNFCKLLREPSEQIPYSVDWAWVDTCCIDKTSSAELSEAINSMWMYYRNAAFCVAYLGDVASYRLRDVTLNAFRDADWFRRGWTLQELLAPASLLFYSRDWTYLGSKTTTAYIRTAIVMVTGIEEDYLMGFLSVHTACVANRMSWAAKRSTTREEDESYSLMGLFDVNMPLLYGEGGRKAFLRLQEHIIRKSTDESLFAWNFSESQMFREKLYGEYRPLGLLATCASDFAGCHDIRAVKRLGRLPYSIINNELELTAAATEFSQTRYGMDQYFALKLNCARKHDSREAFTGCILVLRRHGSGHSFVRMPAIEMDLIHVSSTEFAAKISSGEWKKHACMRFSILLSDPYSDQALQERLNALNMPHRFRDPEGPFFDGVRSNATSTASRLGSLFSRVNQGPLEPAQEAHAAPSAIVRLLALLLRFLLQCLSFGSNPVARRRRYYHHSLYDGSDYLGSSYTPPPVSSRRNLSSYTPPLILSPSNSIGA